jgi:hypothetical protein
MIGFVLGQRQHLAAYETRGVDVATPRQISGGLRSSDVSPTGTSSIGRQHLLI